MSEHWHKIPVWEITVLGIAFASILLVFILWYFFGYKLALVEVKPPSIEPALTLALGL